MNYIDDNYLEVLAETTDLRGSSHLPGSTQPGGLPDPQLYST